MTLAPAHIFTIAPGSPFLATFVEAFLAGKIIPGAFAGDDPAQLAAATIFVPTRRSAAALAQEFARALDQSVVLLPRIVPLGRLEDIETSLAFAQTDFTNGLGDDFTDAVSDIERRVVLAKLILQWAQHLRYAIISMDAGGRPKLLSDEPLLVATSPAQAWQLSSDLASLIDDMIIEGVAWDALEQIVPDAYDQYWRITLDFLQIAMASWPAHLAERKLTDKAERQKHLVDAEIARLASAAQSGPVIAIGSTGANPATARLLGATARLPQGAVILPGLDRDLDETAWALIEGDANRAVDPSDGHPQAMLSRLLRGFGATRAEVIELGAPSPALRARARFVSEAMRPADATDTWLEVARALSAEMPLALANVTLIEAADEREEALCLAIEARRLLERSGATGAIVTPDRALARRVKGELARWNIEVDDSAGDSLALAPIGVLARLISAAALDGGAVELLALLSHPFTRLGHDGAALHRLIALLEIGVWRAIPTQGLDSAAVLAKARLAASERDAHPAAQAITDAEWTSLCVLLQSLDHALSPLRALGRTASLADWIAAHRTALTLIAAAPDTAEGDTAAEELMAVEDIFVALADPDLPTMDFPAADYAALIEQVFAETTIRSPKRAHPRLKILGPLEARLLHADVILLGGLDETIWPPPARNDPFLNRPMRAALGLGPPERRIGQTAHDFVQSLGAPTVIMSRARKRGGAPTTPSRFLQRMAALAGESEWRKCSERGDATIALARLIDDAPAIPVSRPTPKPPLDLRPTSLSVTRIETLRRDPYAIYAERILKLRPLGPIGVEPGARETGTLLHEVMAEFARRWPAGEMPDNPLSALHALARENFAAMFADPSFRLFLWPRIEKGLADVIDWEEARRSEIAHIDVEEFGRLAITLADSSIFNLTAQADRIERRLDGSLVAIDFKTGSPPSIKVVAAGFAPQLTLEAAMIEASAFDKVPAAGVVDALYVRILGSEKNKVRSVKEKGGSLRELAVEHFSELRKLLDEYRRVETPYIPRPYPQFINVYGDYDHLARVKEWSDGAQGGGS